jgi:hypothetical protein
MPSAALLGPPLGVAGIAAALATLLRDEPLSKAMHVEPGPPLQVALSLLNGIVAFFEHGVQGEAARCVLAPLFGLALVATTLFGLEARARHARSTPRSASTTCILSILSRRWLLLQHAAAHRAAGCRSLTRVCVCSPCMLRTGGARRGTRTAALVLAVGRAVSAWRHRLRHAGTVAACLRGVARARRGHAPTYHARARARHRRVCMRGCC